MASVRARAYAKVNLTLDVLARRPDRYHEVETIMQSLEIHDALEFREGAEGTQECAGKIQIECDHPGVPLDESNLVCRAAVALRDMFTAELEERFGALPGAEIALKKGIPVAAGLGGGSADAAVTLLGLARLWGLAPTEDELIDLAAGLGADVVFCLRGGTALAQGIGERVTRLMARPGYFLVLVTPPFAVSTAAVYRALRLAEIAADHRPDTVAMLDAVLSGRTSAIAAGLANVLETVTFRMHPELARLKEALIAAGARGALMSGSGPAVFGLADHREHAQEIARRLRDTVPEGFDVYVAKARNSGVELN